MENLRPLLCVTLPALLISPSNGVVRIVSVRKCAFFQAALLAVAQLLFLS